MSIGPPNDPGLSSGFTTTRSAKNIALINGTQTFTSATTPNDGNQHLIIAGASLVVTSAETGGAIAINFTTGGVASISTIVPSGQGTGTFGLPAVSVLADPGTLVSIVQQVALVAGAASMNQAVLEIH